MITEATVGTEEDTDERENCRLGDGVIAGGWMALRCFGGTSQVALRADGYANVLCLTRCVVSLARMVWPFFRVCVFPVSFSVFSYLSPCRRGYPFLTI